MKLKAIFAFASFGLAVMVLSGCVIAFGNRVPDERKATLGKQLVDLKQARDSGALTEEEYTAAKKRLLDGKPTGPPAP